MACDTFVCMLLVLLELLESGSTMVVLGAVQVLSVPRHVLEQQ